MAGVVALLTIACVNVATVLLGRATTRRKEIAVRLALGASRRRVVRQLLTECALLAIAGGALGLMIAQSVAALFLRFRPDGVPPFDLTLDYRIMLFGIGASLLTVVLFGLAPALQTTQAGSQRGVEGHGANRPGPRISIRPSRLPCRGPGRAVARTHDRGGDDAPQCSRRPDGGSGFPACGCSERRHQPVHCPRPPRRPRSFLSGGRALRRRHPRRRAGRAGRARADGRVEQSDDDPDCRGWNSDLDVARHQYRRRQAILRCSTSPSNKVGSSPPRIATRRRRLPSSTKRWRDISGMVSRSAKRS